MRNYYFLIAGLPDLTVDQGKLQFGSVEFREYLKLHLHKKDYELIEWIFLPEDNKNLLALLKEESYWSSLGIYSRDEFEVAIAREVTPDKVLSDEPSKIKSYLKIFINSYYSESRLIPEKSPENELATLYYQDTLSLDNKFLLKWFEFEFNLKNLLVFNTAQKYNLPYENELIGESSLAISLKQKSGREIGEAAEWPYFDALNQLTESSDIALREKAIDQLRWTFLDESNTFNYFSIEVIISYLIKIMIIERWLKLDPATGEGFFRKLIGDLQSSYEFPNEFSISDGKK